MGNIFTWHMWRGLNLLETLLVMLLVGFAVMLTVNLTMITADGDQSTDENRLVTTALQEKMEELRAGYLEGLRAGHDEYQGLTRAWRVTKIGPHLKRIDVELIGSLSDCSDEPICLATYVTTNEE